MQKAGCQREQQQQQQHQQSDTDDDDQVFAAAIRGEDFGSALSERSRSVR